MIPTILFPLYFRKILAVDVSSPDLLWSIVVAIPVLIMGLVSPILGALADHAEMRKVFLIASFGTAILFTGLLAIPGHGSLILGSLVFMGAMLAFHASLFLYDSFLPLQTSRGKGTAFLSGLGWGIGYVGGLLCMAIVYLLIKDAELPASIEVFQLSFLIVAIYYLVFSLPVVFFLKEPHTGISEQYNNAIGALRSSLRQVISTLRKWKDNREIFKFLIGFYLVNDGLTTLVYFTSVFAAETVKMTVKEILFAYVIVQGVGVVATILLGLLAERVGTKLVLLGTVFFWILIIPALFFAQTKEQYYLISIAVGFVIGSTPATARALLAQMVKESQTAEIFGFNAFSSRVSSVVGPLLFGAISTATDSQRIAMLSLIVFFAGGAFVLSMVRPSRARSIV